MKRLFFICLLSPVVILAQNLKSDIASINKKYRSLEKMSFTFELNMFETYESQAVYFTQSGIIQKNGRASYQRFDETECINTPAYSVMIDKEEKEVVYAPRKTNFDIDDPSLALSLDSVLLFCKSTQFKKISAESHVYYLVMRDDYPDYNRITIFFDPSTFLIRKLVFYCEEEDISVNNQQEKLAKSRIEINYKDLDTQPALNASDFSYEKYLIKSGDSFKMKPDWKNYHLTVLSL